MQSDNNLNNPHPHLLASLTTRNIGAPIRLCEHEVNTALDARELAVIHHIVCRINKPLSCAVTAYGLLLATFVFGTSGLLLTANKWLTAVPAVGGFAVATK
jgi:hypothetical protein